MLLEDVILNCSNCSVNINKTNINKTSLVLLTVLLTTALIAVPHLPNQKLEFVDFSPFKRVELT